MITRRTPTSGSNHKVAAAWNRRLVLRLLKRHDSLSRRQISDMTGLQGSTLSYIVRDFLDDGVLRVAGKADSHRVGQKQVLLEINPALGWVVGVSLRPDAARAVMLDAAGNRLHATSLPLTGPLESLPSRLRTGVGKWVDEVGAPAGSLLGVGVAVPGVVDSDRGVVLTSRPFRAQQVPLRQLLSEHFAATVVIDHDASFGAIAEAAGGAARHVSHFVYFVIGHRWDEATRAAHFQSFGAALFLNDQVYRGAHFAAGEMDGGLTPARDPVLAADDFAALSDPDGALTPPLAELAGELARPMASVVNLLDVPLAVLGGNCRIANVRFLDALRGHVNNRLIPVAGRAVRVEPSQIGDEAVARGAAIAASEADFDTNVRAALDADPGGAPSL